jgi:predicted ATP-dependent protease
VVIPAANAVHLMLRQDVLDAVAANRFQVYSADSIDEALELLTGYSAASIDARVIARLEEFEALARKFSARGNDKGDGGDDD